MTAQPKSFTLDGKRHKLDPAVPAASIRWLVDRLHVGATDDDVRTEITKRGISGWPQGARKSALTYAVKCHRDNQALYRSGRFG